MAARSAAIAAQMRVREQQLELDDFIRDLERWESDAKKRDKELLAHPKPPANLPPVREKVVFSVEAPAPAEKKPAERQTTSTTTTAASTATAAAAEEKPKQKRIASWDYASWDRFDADAAEDAVDRQPSERDAAERKRKAETERDSGNDLFRRGKFFQAAQCYTRAMELDPGNAMLPANRAMCFLKLEKPRQAEADATRAIELDPAYAKGYYRRAMARKDLEQYQLALGDINKVLELEPSSRQAQDEKQKIVKLLVPAQEKLEPRITEVDAPPAVAVVEPEKPKQPATGVLVEQLPAAEPQEKEEQQQQSAPPTKAVEAAPQQQQPAIVAVPLKLELPETAPQTFFEFHTAWASLDSSPELRAKLLAMIPPGSLGALFKDSANPSLLGAIVQVLAAHTLPADPSSAAATLQGLTSIGRFDMLALCLSPADKATLKTIFDNSAFASVAPSGLRSKWRV